MHINYFLLSFFISLNLHSQEFPYLKGKPLIRNYPYSEYKANPQIWSVTQDKNGIMYFATAEGILEFDGVRWKTITGEFNGVVRTLAYDSVLDRIYVGARNTFGYLEKEANGNKYFISLYDQDSTLRGKKIRYVNTIRITSGGVFFSANETISRYQNNQVKTWFLNKEYTNQSNDFEPMVVAKNEKGLYTISGDSLSLIPGFRTLDKTGIVYFNKIDSLNYLAISEKNGLLRYKQKAISEFKTNLPDKLKKSLFYCAVQMNDSTYAIGTLDAGIIFLTKSGNFIDHLTEKNGLINNNVKYLFIDKDRGLWAATEKGISHIEYDSPIREIGKEYGLDAIVESLYRYGKKLYIGTGSGTFLVDSSFPDGKFIPQLKPVPQMTAQGFGLTRVGKYLIAGTGDGIYQIEPTFKLLKGMPYRSACVYASPMDSSIILAGLIDGVAILKFEKNSWQVLGRLKGISSETWTIAYDSDNYFWAGTKSDGAVRFKLDPKNLIEPESVEIFGKEYGFAGSQINVTSVENEIILCTNNGLFSFNKEKKSFERFSKFGTSYTDGSKWVDKIYQHPNGDVYLIEGIAKDDKTEIKVIAKNDSGSYSEKSTYFLRLKKKMIFNLFFDRNEVWLGGPDGVFKYDLNSKFSAASAPATIRSVKLNGDSLLVTGSILSGSELKPVRVQYPFEQIRFEFSSLGFNGSDDSKFQFYLERFDHSWSEITSESQKDYTNIQPGKYRFWVRSINILNQTGTPDFIDVIILPPWYRTWWMYVIYSLIALTLIYLFVKWRTTYLSLKTKELEDIVNLKSAQLFQSEKMASLGQMAAGLSHEINNPLTIISMNIETLKLKWNQMLELQEATEKLIDSETHFKKLDEIKKELVQLNAENIDRAVSNSLEGIKRITGIVDSMKVLAFKSETIVPVNINQQIEEIASMYFKSEKLVKFEYSLSAIPSINCNPSDVKRMILNIIENSVNAVVKAVKHSSISPDEGKIYIETLLVSKDEKREIEFRVKDNGIGIPESISVKIFDPFFSTNEVGSGIGLGLTEVYAIVKRLNGKIEIQSKEKSGTEIKITVPVSTEIHDLNFK